MSFLAPSFHRGNGKRLPPRPPMKYRYARASAYHPAQTQPQAQAPTSSQVQPQVLVHKKSLYLRAKETLSLQHVKNLLRGKGKAALVAVDEETATDEQSQVVVEIEKNKSVVIVRSQPIRWMPDFCVPPLPKEVYSIHSGNIGSLHTTVDQSTKTLINQEAKPNGPDRSIAEECLMSGAIQASNTKIDAYPIDDHVHNKQRSRVPKKKLESSITDGKSLVNQEAKPDIPDRPLVEKCVISGAIQASDTNNEPRPQDSNKEKLESPIVDGKNPINQQRKPDVVPEHPVVEKYMMSGAIQASDQKIKFYPINDHVYNKLKARDPKEKIEYRVVDGKRIINGIVYDGLYDEHYIPECRTGRLMRTASFSLGVPFDEDEENEEKVSNLIDRVRIRVAKRERALVAEAERQQIYFEDWLCSVSLHEKLHEELIPQALASLNRRCKEATKKIKEMLEEKRAAKLFADESRAVRELAGISTKDEDSAPVADEAFGRRASHGSSSALITNRLSGVSAALTPLAAERKTKRFSSGSAVFNTPIKSLKSVARPAESPIAKACNEHIVMEKVRKRLSTTPAEREEFRRLSTALDAEMMRKAMATIDPDSSELSIYERSTDMAGYKFSTDGFSDNVADGIAQHGVAVDKVVTDDIAVHEAVADGVNQDGIASEKVGTKASTADETVADDTTVDSVIQDGVMANKVATDKVATDKAVANGAAQDRVAADDIVQDNVDQDEVPEAVNVQKQQRRLRSMRVSTGQVTFNRRISGEGSENWWINRR